MNDLNDLASKADILESEKTDLSEKIQDHNDKVETLIDSVREVISDLEDLKLDC